LERAPRPATAKRTVDLAGAATTTAIFERIVADFSSALAAPNTIPFSLATVASESDPGSQPGSLNGMCSFGATAAAGLGRWNYQDRKGLAPLGGPEIEGPNR
jgi:hypothetical protein